MIGYKRKSRAMNLPVLGLAVAGVLFVTAGNAQASVPTVSAPQAAVSVSVVAPQASARAEMTSAQWRALKAGLDSSKEFTRTVSVGVRALTYTYTIPSGSSIVLQEPVGPVAAAITSRAMTPSFSVHGCGFMVVCVDLDRTDQGALTNGGSAALVAAICLIPAVGTVACIAVGAAMAVAATYISTNGICANRLRLTIGPVGAGAAPRCV